MGEGIAFIVVAFRLFFAFGNSKVNVFVHRRNSVCFFQTFFLNYFFIFLSLFGSDHCCGDCVYNSFPNKGSFALVSCWLSRCCHRCRYWSCDWFWHKSNRFEVFIIPFSSLILSLLFFVFFPHLLSHLFIFVSFFLVIFLFVLR